MEYIRIIYKDKSREIKEFTTKEEMGLWIVDNMDTIENVKREDMSTKIKIKTKDGKEMTRNIKDEKASILENIATMCDDIQLEEERIRSINIITPSIGKWKC
ncbi:hypothetical protein [Clostridium sp. UBA4395]|uniref:hypothetical protein n=1 Tax=Clostridium sp. UBA4395 TaxID=1946360 RepID=UPI0032178E51